MTLRCSICGNYTNGPPKCAEPFLQTICGQCMYDEVCKLPYEPLVIPPGVAPAQQGEPLPSPEGTTAPGLYFTAPEDPDVFPENPVDPLCEDCKSPLSEHTSPVMKDGEVVDLAHPYNSCKRYIPCG